MLREGSPLPLDAGPGRTVVSAVARTGETAPGRPGPAGPPTGASAGPAEGGASTGPSGSASTDPLGDPFLRTRTVLPARPAAFLRRERLVRHLDRALETPLTLVNGSAGAGKTLLAADWAAGLRQPVAWLTAEAGEHRPGVFWAYVLQALRACGTPVSDAVGAPAEASRVDHTLLARLAAELEARERPVVVVLDEFDRVTAPEVAEQLEFVLHHAGRGMRLVLVTRTEPLLPLHRYRAAGELTEIRAAELAFTPEEAVVLLERHGLSLPVAAGRALVDRTRGWAAGLRLCALAARESADPEAYLKEFEAGHSTVADFLLAEVLKRQPPQTQDLLLRVSVLDRFCPGLANALTRRDDAEPILVGLHRENAFVEDLGHAWYRLHPLFGEILRAHLRVSLPGLEPELHRRAARWLRPRGPLTDTLTHAAAAGDWAFAAGALVGDLAIGQLFTGLRSGDLDRLFSGMGPEAAGPATELVRSARDLARWDVERGLLHLRRAQERPAAADRPAGPAELLSRALLETLAGRLTGSLERAERAAEAADRLRREVPLDLLDAHPELTALLLTHLGSTRLWAGRFEDARAVLTAVTGGQGTAATALPRHEAMGHLALIDYLDGWTGRAERKALAGAAEAERFGLSRPGVSGLGLLVLAAVAVDRDEQGRARALLDETALLPSAARDPVTAAARALVGGRLLSARGEARAAAERAVPAVSAVVASPWATGHEALATAAAHLAEGRPERVAEALESVSGGQPASAVEAARMLLAAGRPEAALGLLDGVRSGARTGPAVTVRMTLVRAHAAYRTGDVATARRLVAQALLDARRDRLRGPFRDARSWIRPLLSTAPLDGLAADWLTPGRPRGGAPAALVAEELSGRERDVLLRLARMMSTEEIAADLYVSVNTVKTHLKSVYRKLAVNRRNEAVRRAREVGLV
ncbi:LuxR C-terminal-related transcriptional regulator [Streptomyces sp. NPDC008121]|uniref:LuxR C-terminal-related transcriptional regulator n=1 Tax=Streptomyces sp. NPDC008121 TaxID=3364809 RepID=UPI0036EF0C44